MTMGREPQVELPRQRRSAFLRWIVVPHWWKYIWILLLRTERPHIPFRGCPPENPCHRLDSNAALRTNVACLYLYSHQKYLVSLREVSPQVHVNFTVGQGPTGMESVRQYYGLTSRRRDGSQLKIQSVEINVLVGQGFGLRMLNLLPPQLRCKIVCPHKVTLSHEHVMPVVFYAYLFCPERGPLTH
jgi:hypothetical protein